MKTKWKNAMKKTAVLMLLFGLLLPRLWPVLPGSGTGVNLCGEEIPTNGAY